MHQMGAVTVLALCVALRLYRRDVRHFFLPNNSKPSQRARRSQPTHQNTLPLLGCAHNAGRLEAIQAEAFSIHSVPINTGSMHELNVTL